MRLEHNRDLSPTGDNTSLADRSHHLGRMMRVVIKETTRTDLTTRLKAACRTRKPAQPISNSLRLQAALDASHPGTRCVQHIVLTGHGHNQISAAIPPLHVRARGASINLHIRNHYVRLTQATISAAISHDPQTLSSSRGGQAHSPLVLRARHQQPTGHHTPGELHKNLFKLLARTIAIQMIGLHVRHDLNGRRIVQERPIRLIGLGDENVTRPQVRARTQLRQHTTHSNRRIQPALRQRDRQHTRRRGLAVSTCHPHETHTRRSQRQRLRAVNNTLSTLASHRQLRITLTNRRGHHDDRRRIHVRGVMPDKHPHADRTQMFEHTRILSVRPLDERPARRQQLRDNTHPRATNTDQMETIVQRWLTHGRPPSPVPGPDPPAREPRPHAPATARQPPYPPNASNPATGRRCGARNQR